MKGLLFLIYLLTLVFLSWLVSTSLQFYETLLVQSPETYIAFYLQKLELALAYIRYTDAWNVLAIIGLFSCLLLVFSISNIVLQAAFRESKLYGWAQAILLKLFSALVTLFVFVFTCHYVIAHYSTPRIYSDTTYIDKSRTILLLGTTRHLQSGKINAYYRRRIDAVYQLYLDGKVDRIIISGDHTGDYDEPGDMSKDLIRLGIPASLISLDGAGFRTLDSIVRIKNSFGIRDVIIVSQGFHLQRAIFLSWFYSVDAVGYEAGGKMNEKMVKRELLAKPNLFLDVFIFNTQPAYGKSESRRNWEWSSDDISLLALDLVLLLVALSLAYYSLHF